MSIVTPSYNQRQFLEETIRSVLLQGYPDLEYVVIDGGSTDGSIEIIRKYHRWLAYWVSEADDGYAHALSKGFRVASGEVLAWINSSDLYLPGTLRTVGRAFREDGGDLVYGGNLIIDEAGEVIGHSNVRVGNLHHFMLYGRWTPPQETCFWTRDLYLSCGGINPGLKLAADYDFFLRASALAEIRWIGGPLSCFRAHEHKLSGSRLYREERDHCWREWIRGTGTSRLAVWLKAAFYVPRTRYSTGGWRRLLALPSAASVRMFRLRRD